MNMKKTIVAVGVLAAAGPALAGPITLSAEPLDAAGGYMDRSVVYTGIPGPYSAFALAGGVLAIDDYVSIDPGPTMIIMSMRFVGGVGAVGDVIRFDFLDTTSAPFSNFSVAFPAAGNFIWTITMGTSGFAIPAAGFMQLTATTGTGRWFFTTTAPTVGTNDITVGTGGTLSPQRYNAFELVIPTPGAMALFGLGALAMIRRRR